jgi:4'-phosphopantetheinyl transferase EntD
LARAFSELIITASNPATLSPLLADLFTGGALAAELRGPGDRTLLMAAEAQCLGRAVSSRIQEFAAGRSCARRVLAEFGIIGYPLLVGEARCPIWPDPLVGSITHTSGFCAAVAAEKQHFSGIGVDCEVAERVTAELWPSICTGPEIEWLSLLPADQRAKAATLIFSAKEAFYKCQYPLTREWLYFHAVTVEVAAWGQPRGSFQVRANRGMSFEDWGSMPIQGQYLFHDEFVTAGVACAAKL